MSTISGKTNDILLRTPLLKIAENLEKTTDRLLLAIKVVKERQLDWLHDKSSTLDQAINARITLSAPPSAVQWSGESDISHSLSVINTLALAFIGLIKKKASEDQIQILSDCYKVTGNIKILKAMEKNLSNEAPGALRFFFPNGWETSIRAIIKNDFFVKTIFRNRGIESINTQQTLEKIPGFDNRMHIRQLLIEKSLDGRMVTLWARHSTFLFMTRALQSQHSFLSAPDRCTFNQNMQEPMVSCHTMKGMLESSLFCEKIKSSIKGYRKLEEIFYRLQQDEELSELEVYPLAIFIKERMVSGGELWTATSEAELKSIDFTHLDNSFCALEYFEANQSLWHELTFWEIEPNLDCIKKFLESGAKYFQQLGFSAIQTIRKNPITKVYFIAQMENAFLNKKLISKEALVGAKHLSGEKGRSSQYLTFLSGEAYSASYDQSNRPSLREFCSFQLELQQIDKRYSSLRLNWNVLIDKKRIRKTLKKEIEEMPSSQPGSLKKKKGSIEKNITTESRLDILHKIFAGLLLEEPLAEQLYRKLLASSSSLEYLDESEVKFINEKIMRAREIIPSESVTNIPDGLKVDERFEIIYQGNIEIVLLLSKSYRNNNALASFPKELVEDLEVKISNPSSSEDEKCKRVDAVLTFFEILLNTPGGIPTNASKKKEIQKNLLDLEKLIQKDSFFKLFEEDCKKLLKTIRRAIKTPFVQSTSIKNLCGANTPAEHTFEWIKLYDPQEFLLNLKKFYVELFLKIQPSEFDNKSWDAGKDPDSNAPNLIKYIKLSNVLSIYAAHAILSEKSDNARSNLIQKVIQTAELALEENFYDIASLLFTTCNMSVIANRKVYKKIAEEHSLQSSLQKLNILKPNYKGYREQIKGLSKKILLPLTPVHLRDITFIMENPSLLQNGNINLNILEQISNTKDFIAEKQKLLRREHTSLNEREFNNFQKQLLDSSNYTSDSLWDLFPPSSL